MTEETVKFAIVDATRREVRQERHEDLAAAMRSVGLVPGKIDFGGLGGGVVIVVYQYGLLEPPGSHPYFSLGRQLFAGNAVVYQCDELGDTVDFTRPVPAAFYSNVEQVKRCIDLGVIDRPQTTVNGAVVWQWRK